MNYKIECEREIDGRWIAEVINISIINAAYFEIEVLDGQLVLTPVRMQRAAAVRAKLAQLGIDEDDVAAAVEWSRE